MIGEIDGVPPPSTEGPGKRRSVPAPGPRGENGCSIGEKRRKIRVIRAFDTIVRRAVRRDGCGAIPGSRKDIERK